MENMSCCVCGRLLNEEQFLKTSEGEPLYYLIDGQEAKVFCGPEHSHKHALASGLYKIKT